MTRIKVCLDCKVSCPIHTNNYASIIDEKTFDNIHCGHSVQIMCYNDFIDWKQKIKGDMVSDRKN